MSRGHRGRYRDLHVVLAHGAPQAHASSAAKNCAFGLSPDRRGGTVRAAPPPQGGGAPTAARSRPRSSPTAARNRPRTPAAARSRR
eukprot:7182704-Alexandrium_andersonii.AAC.1